jgi:hypothetical protein
MAVLFSQLLYMTLKLTKESKQLFSFFLNNKCLLHKKTNKIHPGYVQLYENIYNSSSHITLLKNNVRTPMYNLSHTDIQHMGQIPRPATFNFKSIPSIVAERIKTHGTHLFEYQCLMFNINVRIIFLTEHEFTHSQLLYFNRCVDMMLVWLHLIHQCHPNFKRCAEQLTVFVYHTKLLKTFPNSQMALNEINVNTAFTRACSKNAEIVIYRKEEWFKVFIHETFHTFGLDFSEMNLTACHQRILAIFPVQSNVNLFEAYTEYWARIINVSFCSFANMKDKTNSSEYLLNVMKLIEIEQQFALFQAVKVLNFMEISYGDLSQHNNCHKYKEHTNVLSYYVITAILLNNSHEFIDWCHIHNDSLFCFKQTSANISNFCRFIESKYLARNLLDSIQCTEHLLEKLKRFRTQKKEVRNLLTTLRMTACEPEKL